MKEIDMKEHLSALIDSELDTANSAAVLRQLDADGELTQDLQDWQLISDAMHDHPILSPDFMTRFSARLAAEPVVIAPHALKRKRSFLKRALVPFSAAASIAFVGVASWQAYTGGMSVTSPVPGAPAAIERVASNETVNVDADRIHDYLVAHREDAGSPFAGQDMVSISYQVPQR
ncbi:sigma-E factor negative regulatory protein [Jeongeupia naejangsanensis]|uniref:Sigma-E factor negative regulatory protein n=1 Tax=Jeongeupia naejangsanensis TaxID=613195 RepID=A0ABS2BJB0_9NEIS|nr:sigma-E factor negative regulatory protein [Jeongeupia naejangsanensis]MBM3115510.1 sigma-E factor negative regulatory protein [Jeongeupia naejangsanensis]